jgi:hypothetical protein
MRGVRFEHRRAWALNLARAIAAAAFCAALCLALVSPHFSGQAFALEQNIRDVPPDIGFVVGQVEQSQDEGVSWAAPSQEFSLPPQALVRTGGDGSCVLRFLDHSLAAVKPGTSLRVLPRAQELRLAVLSGKVWVRFDYAVQNSRNGIALPYATVMAMGAGSFSFEATGDASVVRVLEGSVEVVPLGGNTRVTVGAGQTLTVGPGGLAPAVAFDVDLEAAGWQPLLERVGLSVITTLPSTTTTIPGTTTTRPLPPDGPVGIPVGGVIVLLLLGCGAVAVLAILGTFIYLGVNRRNRRRMARR